jgi:gliding motility-associated-like protein
MNKVLKTKLFIFSVVIFFITSSAQGDEIPTQKLCDISPVKQYHVKGVEGMIYHWEVEGGVIVSDNIHKDTILIQWNGLGDHNLSVYGEYEGCFTNKKQLLVELKNPPIVNLGPDVELCQGERFTFEVDTGYASVMWQDSSLGLWYTSNKTEKVWVKVSNNFGCEASDTANVLVHNLPILDLGKDTMLCGDSKLVLTAFNNANISPIYRWSINDAYGYPISLPQIEVDASNPGSYWVSVTDVNNCTNIDTINIIACDIKIEKNGIPTVFTPNGDGKNDYWKLDALTVAYPNAIVEVYDRWGRMVFRSKRGYPEPWNGRDKATGRPLPMNNYFYIIYPNKKGESVITGTVTIAR